MPSSVEFRACQVPRVPSLACKYLSCLQSDFFHLESCYAFLIATTNSCASPNASPCLRFSCYKESLQVVANPCWQEDLPDVISATLSVGARSLIPVVSELLLTVSSLRSLPFPRKLMGRVNHNCLPKQL